MIFVILLLTFQLFIPPVVGMANNHDFQRNMLWAGIQYPHLNGTYFDYINIKYNFSFYHLNSHFSSTSVLMMIGTLPNLLFRNDTFDIRVMGFIYSTILVFNFWMFLKISMKLPFKYIMTALVILVFCDIGYTTYFNSFYEEPASYVFLLFILTTTLYGFYYQSFKTSTLLSLLTAILLFILSKSQNSIIGLIFAFYGCRFLYMLNYSKTTITIFLIIVVVASGVCYLLSADPNANLYHTVFYGILLNSPTIQSDMKDLKLDPQFAKFIGEDYYSQKNDFTKNEEFYKPFYSNINFGKVILFYLSHPIKLFNNLKIAAKNAFILRIDYLGNYDKSAGKQPKAKSHAFDVWSRFQEKVFPRSIWFIITFLSVYTGVLAYIRKNQTNIIDKLKSEFLLLLPLMAALQLLACIIGDGQYELAKHLFGFNVIFDLMFVVAVQWLITFIHIRIQKNKSGNYLRPGVYPTS